MASTVLLVANDRQLQDFVLEFLPHQELTVISSPAQAASLLQTHRYALVILTNFGLSPAHVLSAIPKERGYPVLFLTGYVNAAIETQCQEKHIHCRTVPIDPSALRSELRLALDDVEA